MKKNTIQNDFFEGIQFLYIMYKNLGMMYYEKKDYEKALVNFEKTIEHSDILYQHLAQNSNTSDNIMNLLHEQTNDVKDKIVDISNRLGDFEIKSKNFEKAIDYYKNIIYYQPNDELVYVKIGHALVEIGNYVSAVNFFDKAIKQDSSKYDLYRAIGDIYAIEIKNPQIAIDYYKKYVDVATNDNKFKQIIYNSIGHLYEEAGKYENIDKQIEYFNKALEINPNYKDALRNLTIVYPRVRKEKEALQCYHKLFKLGIKMDDYFDYACLNIKLKNFEEGWKYYEYRFSKEIGPTKYPKMKKPKWDGKKITDKTLLIQYEQGFGDTIMFCRYLEQVKPLVGKIIFRVQNEMVDLIKNSLNNIAGEKIFLTGNDINDINYYSPFQEKNSLALIDRQIPEANEFINIITDLNKNFNPKDINKIEIVGMSTPIEKLSFDYHVALISLMHLLDAKVDNIPLAQGYIKADEEKIQKYKKEFFDNDCFKIGISWHGAEHGNELRNIPLEMFYPLAKLKNVKVYAFQKGAGSEEMENLPPDVEIIDLGKTFNDFSDTAAAMANLDLFITSDNAVFNLAGAMGKKTFVLLNQDAEWRWFFDDDTTSWYDSVKIFKKQDENEGWSILMKQALLKLKEDCNIG
jgi:tetratricopeptide (TPR) repeat protein